MFANLVAILRPRPVALRDLLRRAAPGPRLPPPLHLEELEIRLVPSVPRPDHVVVVMEENHGYADIIGSASAPYINALAAQGALMTNSFALEHPSQPNYLDLFSGSNQGVTDDHLPIGPFAGPDLGGELRAAGLTFGGYSEDLPAVGDTSTWVGNYDRNHSPWVDFADVPPTANLPYAGYFPADFSRLPTVSFVVPNLQDDMHDGTIAQGDSWLQNNLDAYAQWAKTHNSLLIVTWDEDDYSGTNRVATLFVGQNVKPGQYGEPINHFNVLRTLEDMYGLPYAGQSAAAAPLTDIWGPAAPGNLAAVAVSGSQVNLAWTNNAANATGFKLYYSTDGTIWVQFATAGPAATAATWLGAAPGGTYFFRVTAYNPIGDSDPSNTAAVTTPSPQVRGPITSLHYTPNDNVVNGQYVPLQDGFNLADDSNVDEINSLPAGVQALVWIGMRDGATDAFKSAVQPFIGNPKVYGFFLYDEPDPTGQFGPLVTAASLKDESDWIHTNDPGAKTFILLMNLGTPTDPSFVDPRTGDGYYTPANTDIDLFGLDPYPIRPQFSGGADYDVIPAYVSAAERSGIPLSRIVPVYQAFGGGGYASWTLPTASQEQQILAAWGAVVPQPAFDFAYSWGIRVFRF
jgi:hypothetical protein